MNTKTSFLALTAALILFCNITFAIPAQDEFYHNYYTIESKGFSGKVFTRSAQTGPLVRPALGEHVSLYYNYQGSYSQQWIIAPIASNSSEFYIINMETGFPLMIDGTTIRCNTSGITDDRQRFTFKNVKEDYFQIQSAVAPGCFYRKKHPIVNILGHTTGYYYSIGYSTDPNINDGLSYFKLTAVADIPGSGNVSASNIVYQPNMLFNIPEPPQLTGYMESAPLFINETVIGESWVPFTLVHDAAYSPSILVTESPFYKLIRTQVWKKTMDFSYEPIGQYTSSYRLHKGTTDLLTTQITLGHSWSADGKAEFKLSNFKAALGASYSELLSIPDTLVNQYTDKSWEEISKPLIVNTQAKVRFMVYQLIDIYYIKRMDGSDVVSPLELFNGRFYKLKIWSSTPTIVSVNTLLNTTTITDDYTPQNFRVGAKNNHPYLEWNASTLPGLVYYEVWKKKNEAWSVITTTTNTFYTNTGESIIAPGTYVYYKVCAVNNAGQKSGFTNEIKFAVTGGLSKENPVSEDSIKAIDIPAALQIQNYPNPFNPSTNIRFDLPYADNVLLQVFDINGQLVSTLVDGYLGAGNHVVAFNAQHLSSGIYLYRLTNSKNAITKRMLFLK